MITTRKEINEAKISTIWDKEQSVEENFEEWSKAVTDIYHKYEQEKKQGKDQNNETVA